MRRPAQHHPTAGAWLHPYRGPAAHAVFYNDGGSPPPAPPVPTPADLARQQPTPPHTPSPQAPPADGDEEKVTFTQRRLNVIMKDEKEEGRRSAFRQIAEAAGLDPNTFDPARFGEAFKQAETARQQKLSDEQRRAEELQRQAQELQTGKASLEQQQAELADARRALAREQALIRLGALDVVDEQGQVTAPNLQDAVAMLERDLRDVEDADAAAVHAAAEALKKRRPELFSSAPTPQSLPPAPSGGPAAGNLPHQPNPGKNALQEAARKRAIDMGLRPAS
ncbi:hypothetical protein ABZ383_31065 [Streptomyces sp. NPDC005900]|uniref:hypothetical protein n=1 Tax=Streptomyces sp. NPDC005900 TaxID=3154569 RepID=UPI00340C0F83